MKRLTVVAMLLVGAVLTVQGQEQVAKPASCPAGWTAGPDEDWKIFWDDALNEARQTGKKIFALSTGSDWCGWCIKLKKEVLTTEAFKDFARKNLVLLYLDSPRKPLPEAQTLHNRAVCRELRLAGGVPCAAVFAADARRLGVLSGGGYTASNYVARLEKMQTEKGEMPKSGQPSKIFTEGYGGLNVDDADKKSQEELKKLEALIRAKKPAEAERKKKAMNGRPVVHEVMLNDVKWTYEIVDDGVILGNAGEGWVPAVSNRMVETLIIPEVIDGKPVRGIGSGAFWRCTRLASLKLPSSLRSIGYAAFEDCIGLASLTIPLGVTNISSRAFRNCTKLKSVEIPSSVKNIGNSAFSGCDGLTAISVEKDNATYCSVDGIVYDKSMTIVRCCPGGRTGSITIPDGVTRIGDSAFEGCKGLTSVMIPQSVERIDGEAFRDCSGLSSVEIPSGVKRIGSQAFWGCSSLTSMAIPASVTDIAKVCYWGAFGCCGNLKSFTVDPANTAYSSRNGMLCSKDGKVLVAGVNGDVEIPSGVTHIGLGAFYGCEGLASVAIPQGVISIGSSAFSHCKGLTSVTIPSGVSSIGYQAFSWNPSLRQVDIPASVRKIGDHAFIACPKLVAIDIRGEGVEIDRTAFGRDTPVGAKMPDLSKPVGPIHVVVGKNAPVEKPVDGKCIAESVTENVHARTVRHCKASEVKKALDELTASGGAVKGPFSVTANDRLNKLIIVTDKSNLAFVDAVVRQLDQE